MYLATIAGELGIFQLDMVKAPKILLRPEEEHFLTYIFDALPYVPQPPLDRATPTAQQIKRREDKGRYLEKLQYLEKISVELGQVRPKPKTCPKCNHTFIVPIQKLVDVKLSVRMTSLAAGKVVDKILLVAGDGDLLPAIEAVNEMGIPTRLAYAETPRVQTSHALIKACREKHKLTPQDIQYMKL